MQTAVGFKVALRSCTFVVILHSLLFFCSVGGFIAVCFADTPTVLETRYISDSEDKSLEENLPKEHDLGKRKNKFASLAGKWRESIVPKPVIHVGYYVALPVEYSYSVNGNPFTDLTTASNWLLGAGFQINKYISFSAAYTSIETQLNLYKNTSSSVTNSVNAKMLLIYGTFWSPPINFKFVDLAGYVSMGIAANFGVGNTYKIVSGSNAISGYQNASGGVGFFGEVGIVVGFSRIVSISMGVQLITINNVIPTFQQDMTLVVRPGFTINIYLI